jgi:hypothetical protein
VFVGALTGALLFLVWWYVDRVGDAAMNRSETAIRGLVEILKLCLYLVGLLILLYLIAPSAEQAGKWIATVTAWRSGVSTASTARSRSPDGGTAEASTTAGPAAAPAAPPDPPARPDPPAEDLPDYAR